MDLDFSEEQLMLGDTVARLCGDHHGSDVIRDLERDELGYTKAFWQGMADMGLCGLTVDESHGGIGLGCMEAVLVHEQMGRTLAPSPHLGSCIIAAYLIEVAGTPEQQQQWLGTIASGETIAIPAWHEVSGSIDPSCCTTRLRSTRGHWVLDGEKVMVPFANSADVFLVPTLDEEGVMQLALVLTGQVQLRAQPNHADQNLYAVALDAVELPAESMLQSGNLSAQWDEAMLRGLICVAAQAVGGASSMLEMANDYAKEREQFGQPIGAFQAIAHYLADRATELEGARYLTYQAAWACDNGEPWVQRALMAKLQATAVFRRTTVTGVQVHGGMGFSSEADPQLYYRRAKHLQLMDWDSRYLEQRIADEVFA